MDLSVPIPTIDMAVAMRDISVYKDERLVAAELYDRGAQKQVTEKQKFIDQLHDALFFSTIISYAQGLALLHRASSELDMNIPAADVVRIWRGGCIIRSGLLDGFYRIYKKNPSLPNLLLDKKIVRLLRAKEKKARAIMKSAVGLRIPVAGLSSAIAYFDAYASGQLPTNLIQAQRDFFGAHTYERVDKKGTFHNEWQPLPAHKKEEVEHKP
jgi:6-phosphogluconate dehydrogenase